MKFLLYLSILYTFLAADPIVLIIENKSIVDTLKEQAVEDVISFIDEKSVTIERIQLDFSTEGDFKNLENYFLQNGKNIVYIIAPENTSEYKKIKPYLPQKTPIITGIGTASVLDQNNTWVTTVSALSNGKALAIESLLKVNKTKEIVVINDEVIDTYSMEVITYLKKAKIKIKFVNINDEQHSEYYNNDQLVLLASKTGKKAIDLFNRFNDNVYKKFDLKNNILLLKISEEDKQKILFSHDIYYLSYDIPGYLPDLRLPLYESVHSVCEDYKSGKNVCYRIYGKTYKKLHMYLDMGLKGVDFNAGIEALRQNIYANIIQYNKDNSYYNQATKNTMQFKKLDNFYYNSSIESGLTNYYVVRLDKQKDFLHPYQVKIGNDKKIESLSTVYIDFKLEKLVVADLSASKVYIEGMVRIFSVNEKVDLEKHFQINFSSDSLKKPEVILVQSLSHHEDEGTVELYEKFYMVRGDFNINNDLWKFPYDEQQIYISFKPKDFINNPFVVQLQENTFDTLDFDEWTVQHMTPFVSDEIVKFSENIVLQKASIFYKPTSNFEITITRNTTYSIMLKFILPVLIIVFLIMVTYWFFHTKSSLDATVDIYISAFAGIISIYFIFNLLIDIENLIIFDIIFLFFIFLSIFYIILNMFRYEYGELKEKHKKKKN